jgi:protein-L-isoaspartate(D-aspartate) O-methyltransferase
MHPNTQMAAHQPDLTAERERMVQEQLVRRGIANPAVLAAFRLVPREFFVSDKLRALAYDDGPLPIGLEQTISQPHVVALMLELAAISATDRVLEIGTGSGYSAALMAHIAAQVFTVERHHALLVAANQRLLALGLSNVHTRLGDGALGWPEAAPFDAIFLMAATSAPPAPLLDQLAPGGRMLIPAGRNPREQTLLRLTRLPGGGFRREDLGAVSFVPLVTTIDREERV